MDTRKTYKEILKTPSAALEAMIKGLINQSKRDDFDIDMGTFGSDEYTKCFGCAATCTVQEVMGINFTYKMNIGNNHDRANVLNTDSFDQTWFENSIDSARQGDLDDLFEYFGLSYKLVNKYEYDGLLSYDMSMNTRNWKQKIPAFEALIKQLKKDGY